MPDAALVGDGLEPRLLALIAKAGALLGSPQAEDILQAILRISTELVSADLAMFNARRSLLSTSATAI